MKCIICGYEDSKVIDSRLSDDGRKIRRRRECLNCGKRFTTYETYEKQSLLITKQNGDTEEYERKKLIASLKLAFGKRLTDFSVIDRIADFLEQKIEKARITEISSESLGSMVLDRLSEIDKIAYFIYAINFYRINSIPEIQELLDTLTE